MKKQQKGKKFILDSISGSIIGLVNGFLGSGGGIIAVPILEKLKKLDNKKSHATAIAVILPLSVVSAIIYSFNFSLSWKYILLLSIGASIGGLLGSIFLKKLNGKIVRIIFALLLVFAGVKSFF